MSEFFSVTFSDRCVRLDAFRQCISTNAPLAGCDSLRTNHGYNHNENDSEKGYSNLTTTEKKMVLRGLRTFGTIDIASDSLSRGEPVFAEVPVQIRVLAMP